SDSQPHSLHDALPICLSSEQVGIDDGEVARTEARGDRALARADPAGQTEHLGGHAAQPTAGRASWPSAIVAGARLLAFERGRSRSEEHTSELQSRENL